jgi:AcrR family transcriptional regulator
VKNSTDKEEKKTKTRQQRRVKDTHLKLLNAARDAFAEKGLDYTTIDDITERADVGKGTFYYHFSNKQDVVAELIDGMLSELVKKIEQRCEGLSELATLLDTIVKVHIDYFNGRWEDFVLYYQGRADLTLKEGYSGIDQPFLKYLESIEKLVESVIKQRMPKSLLRRFGCAVAGFVSGYYSFAVIDSVDEDVDKSLMEMRGAFVSSLARFINESLSTGQSRRKPGEAGESD